MNSLKKLYLVLLLRLVIACSSTDQQVSANEDDELEVSDQEEGLDSQQSFKNSKIDNANLEAQGTSNSYGNGLDSNLAIDSSPPANNMAKAGLDNLSSDISGNSSSPSSNSLASGQSASGASQNSTSNSTATGSAPGLASGESSAPATQINASGASSGEQAQVVPRLTWVGFDYRIKEGQVRVEIVTEGNPKYGIFGEVNQKNQPELVIRLYQTSLKKKIRRDIDCSEFRSPIAYIRMREDVNQSVSDVVITLRDKVNPKLFAEKGNILLTFSIPDKYGTKLFKSRMSNSISFSSTNC